MILQKVIVRAAVVALCASSALAAGRRRSRRGGAPPPTHEDVKYDTKHKRNVLDFWQAKSGKPTPVVVWFHGGGFKQGDKAGIRRSNSAAIREFLEHGVSFASCNYPFLEDASYFEIMRHCARAIQFLRSKQKEWNIDPTRMGAFGASAGALISEWIAYHGEVANRRSRDRVDRFSSSLAVVGGLMQPMGTDFLVMPQMRRGGPPLFLYTNCPPSDGVHHPKYAKMIKARADKLRIPAELYGGNRNDIPPPPEGESALSVQLKFFCKHLGVKHPAKK